MTLYDHQILDIIDGLCNHAGIPQSERPQRLRDRSAAGASIPAMAPLVDRYLAIVAPAPTCQVEHDHWEGKMICGNPLPCRTHGGGR